MSSARPSDRAVVLVVDDNSFVLKSTGAHLESIGYGVLSAKDGIGAVKILDTADRVDVLLTDVVMPGDMGGRELAREARQRHKNLKTLMFSGYPREELVESGKINKDARLLCKPFGLETLERALRNLIGNGRAT